MVRFVAVHVDDLHRDALVARTGNGSEVELERELVRIHLGFERSLMFGVFLKSKNIWQSTKQSPS